jgi:hypothetical protein
MEDAGSGGWNGEPAWTGRTSGRDPQGSVPFQTRPSDRPFSSPVALPESYVLPVPWRAPPSPRFNHALQLLRPSSWLGRCRRLRSSSSPDRGEHCRMRDCSRRRRRAAAPHRAPTARPRRTSSLRRHRDLTTKCVVRCCDKSPTEPKHVRPVSSFTRVCTRGPTHG